MAERFPISEIASQVVEEMSEKKDDLDFNTIPSEHSDLSFDDLPQAQRPSPLHISKSKLFLNVLGEQPIAPFNPFSAKYKETPRIGADMVAAATLGLFPSSELRNRLPSVTTPTGQVLDVAGQGIGLVEGLPGGVAGLAGKGLSRLFPSLVKGIVGRAAIRGTEGAIIGGLSDITTPSRVPERATLGAGINILLPPVVNRVVRDIQAFRFGRALGIPSKTAQAPARLDFITQLQREGIETSRTSGEEVGNRIRNLQAQYPERQQILAQHLPKTIQELETGLSSNPGLSKAILKAADDTGNSALVEGVFPELRLGMETTPETPSDVVSVGRASFRRAVIQELRASGKLPQGIAPENLTLDQLQQLKRVYASVNSTLFGKVGAKWTRTHLDALEGMGAIREAELAAHPELAEEFTRHHHVMESFRKVKDLLSNPDLMETALRLRFGGTAGKQESFRTLLSPGSFLKGETFADAGEVLGGLRTVARRALFYTTLFPLYSLFSLLRSELYRSSR